MKKLLVLLLFIPTVLFAQDNSKYMAGAVPTVNGKVVFSKEINLPGQTQEQIFSKALKWANETFITKEEFKNRVLFSVPNLGQISCIGQQYLVFTNKAFSLDRTIINYQMHIECLAGKCNLKILAIHYIYNVDGQNEVYSAEEQIIDKYTITKKKKLIKSTGKFRIHTIDLIDKQFNELEKTLQNTSSIIK